MTFHANIPGILILLGGFLGALLNPTVGLILIGVAGLLMCLL